MDKDFLEVVCVDIHWGELKVLQYFSHDEFTNEVYLGC